MSVKPDTTDMVLVHRVFRRELRLAPRLVRHVGAGDTAQAGRVAAHVAGLLDALHHHHSGEDELVWPKLLQRAPLDDGLVARMQAQHETVAGLLEQVRQLLAPWQSSASPLAAQRLAETSEALSVALDEHLAEEERRVLPLVEEHLSVTEWDQVGERGFADTPKERLLFLLGAVLEEASPAEQARFLPRVPVAGRVAFRLIGRRRYRHQVATLRAGLQRPAAATAATAQR